MSGSPQIIFHKEHWPLGYVQYIGPLTDENWDALLAEFSDLVGKKERFGWINDARTPHLPNARQRKALADLMSSETDAFGATVAAVANISSSPLVRGIVTALSWIAPLPSPVKMFPNVLDGENFVRKALDPGAPPLTEASYPISTASRATP